MKKIISLIIIFQMVACTQPLSNSPRQVASVETKRCDKNAAIKDLETLFDNYEFYPSFVVSVATQTLVQCLGSVTYIAELSRIHKEKKGNIASNKKNRLIASTNQSSYRNWANFNKAVDITSSVTMWTGDSVLVATALGTAALLTGGLAPAVAVGYLGSAWIAREGFHVASDLIKQLNIATEMSAANYYDKILSQAKVDRNKLKVALESSDDIDVRVENFRQVLKQEAAGFVDLNDKLLQADFMKGIEASLDATIRYAGEVGVRVGVAEQDIVAARNDLNVLTQSFEQHVKTTNDSIKYLKEQQEVLVGAVSNLQTSSQFQLQVMFKNMSTSEKIFAIEKLGVGQFENPADRQASLDMLKGVQQAEALFAQVSNVNSYIQGTAQVFENLGIESPELAKLMSMGNKAMSVSMSYLQFMSGNIMGSITSLSSVFGKKKDATQEMLKQLFAVIQELMKMLQTILRLQYQTISLLDQMSSQMDKGFRRLDQSMTMVLKLQQMGFVSNYLDKTEFISECNEFTTDLKTNMLIGGRSADQLSTTDLSQKLQSSVPDQNLMSLGQQDSTYLDLAVLQLNKVPDGNFQSLHYSMTRSSNMSVSLTNCLNKINSIRRQFSQYVQGKGPLDSAYTTLGSVIPQVQNEIFRDFLDEHYLRQMLFSFVLNTIGNASQEKNKTVPYQVIYAGLHPSLSNSELVSKIRWIRNAPAETKSYIDSKSMQQMMQHAFSKSELIDPNMLISFLKIYLQVYPLSRFLTPNNNNKDFVDSISDVLDTSRDHEIIKDMKNMVRLIELAIFQQTLSSGDVMLEFYDAHFDPYYMATTDTSNQESLIDDMITNSKADLKRTIQNLVLRSPTILKGLIKYRLVKAMKKETRFSYMLRYNLAMTSNYPDLLNDVYGKMGLELYKDDKDGKWYLRFKEIEKEKAAALAKANEDNTPENKPKDKDKMYNEVSKSIQERTSYFISNFNFENKLDILSPDEVYADETVGSPYLSELISLRDAFMLESYHYQAPNLSGKRDYDLIHASLKRMVFQ